MVKVQDGRCGMCAHFGEKNPGDAQRLVQIRVRGEAPEDLLEPCGHPGHEGLHLRVSVLGACDGFTPATS